MEKLSQNKLILQNISILISIALGFIMPVFFLTTTTEFFEFNKLAVLVGTTILLVLLWGIRILLGQKLEIVKSSLDLPIVVAIIVTVLATLFSVNKVASIYGSQGRWFPSLFGLVVLFVFFYISTPNLRDMLAAKWAAISLVLGSTVSTIVAVLSYYKIFLGSEEYLKTTAFNLSGSVTTTVVLAVIASVIALGLLVKETAIPTKLLLATTIIVNFFYIALTNTIMGWTLFIVGLITTLLFTNIRTLTKQKHIISALAGIMVVIIALMIVPTTKNVIRNETYPFENTLPLRESWIVSSATIQDYPLLATGPSTFGLNFTKYKPLSINNSPIWNNRFDKPYNELLNVLGTTGIIGLIVVAFFAIKAIKLALASKENEDSAGLSQAIASAVIVALCTYLFTYATVLNTFILVFLLSILVAVNSIQTESKLSELISFSFASFSSVTTTIGETSAVKKEYMNLIMVIPILAGTLYGGFLFTKTYAGEYYMRKSIEAAISNQATKTYEYQTKAINVNPTRDAYQTAYAQTNIALANALAGKTNLTDTDKQTIQTLVAQAIKSTRIATEVNNPLNVDNWQVRALIYKSLINVADNATDWTIGAYNTAIQLDPTNPTLRLDLGGVYFASKDYLSAANLFRQAATIKPDYANAHYNFAQALIQLKDYENAKKELQVTQTLIPQDSEDYKKVGTEIASIDAMKSNVAGASTSKPTVEQIVGANNNNAQQAPLTKPTDNTGTNQGIKQGTLPIN